MTFPQALALPEELDRLMRRVRLPCMRKAAPDVLATARAQRWDPAEVLRLLIAEEVTGRDAATRRLRRHSRFPSPTSAVRGTIPAGAGSSRAGAGAPRSSPSPLRTGRSRPGVMTGDD
ncbi:hypothetical protein [Streptomyces atratus]|uniref:hypothetical protein n=1 Tax=Streptomyces atratus TaxID=1893 RepID=UPI0022593EFD|nr:hypothetical protein [Streptomyces atratus]MCX5345865.1 hypothetical protein [Streptomyces atratus]